MDTNAGRYPSFISTTADEDFRSDDKPHVQPRLLDGEDRHWVVLLFSHFGQA
jgi:hypothetical protein